MIEVKVRENLKLVQLSERHATELFELTDNNRTHLREWLPWLDATVKREDTVQYIRSTRTMPTMNFVIIFNDKIVGCVGQNQFCRVNKTATLGYWLAKEFNGQGIMSDSVKALINFSFKEMEVDCVVICAATGNTKSRKLIESLGFQFEGILRQREWLYDHFVDLASYSLLQKEWKFSAA